MISLKEILEKHPRAGWIIYGAVTALVLLLGFLTFTIMDRRAEALYAYTPAVNIKAFEPDSAVWGKNFPKEYESYRKTAYTSFRSKHNGSAVRDMLAENPSFVILWAGYPFSFDYKQGRGHMHAITDIHETLRTGAPMSPNDGPMPATCWTCKSTDVPRLMHELGSAAFYKGSWASRGGEVKHPIGCADCHDNATMELKITRPALIEAFKRMGRNIDTASHQEMRSLVCAQCHVEYYFKGADKFLTFPWDTGMSAEEMEAYYDSIEFSDWTHTVSKAPMIKCQHPDYELYLSGLHARRGVSCADCHMPYRSEGAQKFTDHHIQSPLNNIAASCQVCHRESEDELRATVYARQDAVLSERQKLESLLVRAHFEAAHAWSLGAGAADMKPALTLIRHAQWRWDFVAASHGGSFHSAVESARIISSGIAKAQEARVVLARVLAARGMFAEIALPDVSTKAAAQERIGVGAAKRINDKNEFLKRVVPAWLTAAKK